MGAYPGGRPRLPPSAPGPRNGACYLRARERLRAGDPLAWARRAPRRPGGRKEVRPGPRPRDSSSSGAGRVSGSAGFGMTQSPRLGPGASSALPVRDSPTVGGFRCSQECPRGGRTRLCARRPWGTRWWFCPIRNVQDRVPSSRVIASLIPSRSGNSEPDFVSGIL